MARGRERWGTKALRLNMPLPSERQSEPRSDGTYGSERANVVVAFSSDGSVSVNGERATWTVHDTLLRFATPTWDCEGAIGLDSLFLLASPGGDRSQRVEWELRFSPD